MTELKSVITDKYFKLNFWHSIISISKCLALILFDTQVKISARSSSGQSSVCEKTLILLFWFFICLHSCAAFDKEGE